ncbi:B-box zinc finger protein 22 [Linum grandiflorum]
MAGLFFCLEDRALLCRKCDVAIHTANEHVSVHQRFLLTGVKTAFFSGRVSSMPFASLSNDAPSVDGMRSSEPLKVPFAEGNNAGAIQQWQLDDFFSLTGFNQNYSYLDNGSSKADSGKRSDSDNSGMMRSGEDEMDNGECLGQASESCWAVPEMPSPPTASGLCWLKSSRQQCDMEDFVPDIRCSAAKTDHDDVKEDGRVPKRPRQQRWTLF